MSPAEIVTVYQPTLFSIAYRMTGEVMTSEDIVQDVLLNWMSRAPASVQDAKAYLARSVVNASLNHLTQVKRQREAYKGVWLPEPILTTQHKVDAQLDISYGFMLLLGKLSPMERAVFVLKESFDVPYAELAGHFDTTEANCRQLYHRANEKLAGAPRRFPMDAQHQQTLIQAFRESSETGDIETLIALLKTDVVAYSDGGGHVPAAGKPLAGLPVVANFLRSLNAKYSSQVRFVPTQVNGELALLITETDTQLLTTVMVIELDECGISGIYSIRNPDKLAHLR